MQQGPSNPPTQNQATVPVVSNCYKCGDTGHLANNYPQKRLREHKLYAKLSKCEFWIDEVPFLGHIVSKGGITVDPHKVSAVTNWETPQTPKEIHGFLGLSSYYRRFIENHSRIAKPMTSLLEKDAEFKWTAERQATFDELKKRLTTTPLLSLPDQQKKFTMYCDASRDGLGCVLMQEGKVVAYASRQLCKHEVNYPTHDLKLATVQHLKQKPTLEQEIRKHQKDDEKLQEIRELLKVGNVPHFREDEQGILWYKNRICVPNVDNISKLILSEAHDTTYSIHPGNTNMYYDLKEMFWWYGMKRVVAEYVAICDTFQCVKTEHQRPAGLLQPLKVLEWKWEEITMDFIMGLPRTQKGYNSIWVVVDRLTKIAHFIPVNTTYSGAKLAELYISRIYGTSWDKCLLYDEFSYNNSYQASLKKLPFEALYGKRCKTPLFSNQISEKQGAKQQLWIVRENLSVAQSRQRSYADVRRSDLTFKVDDHVYLKVSPMRGIRRFNMKGKLAPRYIERFKILEKKGEVAYCLELPPSLSGVHDLKKCLRVPKEQAPLEGLEVQEDLTYTEHPIKILDRTERVTRNKRIKMCRVQSHRTEAEAIWE
ncbi:hypothetical protein U9M48_043236 [Paspalum notatum var. saurae]|uniref:CCHC-type domain-containing protein n=1 Tax=Paspalum notatum var. saurae TaxID=547442 RepID=A0AAQ3XIF2_PASNO